jgi:hypothetical protein
MISFIQINYTVMDDSRDILHEHIYEGIYRDDGIAVFKGSVTTGKVAKWLGIFQARVNHFADSKFLEFTAEIWGNDKDHGRKYKAVRTTNKNYFPFLDMECIGLRKAIYNSKYT